MLDDAPHLDLADNSSFTEIRVRLLLPGTPQHRDEAEEREPAGRPVAIVEFRARRFKHDPNGQYLASYYLDTLVEKRQKYETDGLILHDRIESWALTPRAFAEAIKWAMTEDSRR